MGAALLFLVLLLFLPIWAMGAWMVPAGPLLFGTPWMGFILIGLLLTLMILALAPDDRSSRESQDMDESMRRQAEEETKPALAAAVLWIFITLALLLIIAAYWAQVPVH